MRNPLILCLALLLNFSILSSCQKEEDSSTTETVEAILVWTGEPALDGCGFLLRIDDQVYKPTNEDVIPTEFQATSETPVKARIINYHSKEDIICGLAKSKMNKVKILSIVQL